MTFLDYPELHNILQPITYLITLTLPYYSKATYYLFNKMNITLSFKLIINQNPYLINNPYRNKFFAIHINNYHIIILSYWPSIHPINRY